MNLQDFDHLPPEALELLEASGYTNTSSLFELSFDRICEELAKANSVLEIVDYEVSDDLVSEWLKPIEELSGKGLARGGRATAIADSFPHVSAAELRAAPLAIPCYEEWVKNNDLRLDELPQGVIHVVSEDSANVVGIPPSIKASDKVPFENNVVLEVNTIGQRSTRPVADGARSLYGQESHSVVAPLDKTRIQSMEDYQKKGSNVIVPVTMIEDDLRRTTKKGTNKGVSLDSRFFIKGVLHPDIPRFKLGSYALLFVHLLVISAVGLLALIFIDKEKYWWAIFSPALLLPALFIFFTFVRSSTCPICTQKLYALKWCLKHRNAHYWPLFGYMLPTCLHALFFKWFRCIFCGTSVRLKE